MRRDHENLPSFAIFGLRCDMNGSENILLKFVFFSGSFAAFVYTLAIHVGKSRWTVYDFLFCAIAGSIFALGIGSISAGLQTAWITWIVCSVAAYSGVRRGQREGRIERELHQLRRTLGIPERSPSSPGST